MACSCCSTGGCKCQLSSNSPANGFTFFSSPTVWIHRRYPEPIFEATWREDLNRYIASNADEGLTNPSDPFDFYGDISYYSRRGMYASYNNYFGGYVVDDYDGNNSATYMGRTNAPIPDVTVFVLEERQDVVKKECQLWIKFKKSSYDPAMNVWVDEDWSEFELLSFVKWNVPAGPQKIVTIPGERFNGPDYVELRYNCVDPCTIIREKYVITGQADYVTRSVIPFPQDLCLGYGSFEGTVDFRYKNCDSRYIPMKTTNRATKLILLENNQCANVYGGNYVISAGMQLTISGVYGSVCGAPPQSSNNCVGEPEFSKNVNCCGNIMGMYYTYPDGTEVCQELNQVMPGCIYNNDPYNTVIVNETTVIFNGVWDINPVEYFHEYDCLTQKSRTSPNMLHKAGTVTVTGTFAPL